MSRNAEAPTSLITLWNVEWAKPGTTRGTAVASLLNADSPEVVCVTEGYPEILSEIGHLIVSDVDHGYGTTDGRRKVMLWSANTWSEVDCVGSDAMPSGRFISGITETSIGATRFVGVCIPWHDAHVRTGRRDRKPWQDHLTYLDGLASCLQSLKSDVPVIVLGDFNQRIPRTRQPEEVFERLQMALGSGFAVASQGLLNGVNALSIDHLAHSKELDCSSLETFGNISADGMKLSDHFGLRLSLRRGTSK